MRLLARAWMAVAAAAAEPRVLRASPWSATRTVIGTRPTTMRCSVIADDGGDSERFDENAQPEEDAND